MFRAIALSLALLIGIGAIIPLATDLAEAGPKQSRKHRKQAKKYKKYSKAWWRQYRARTKRNRAMQARKRALRLRQLRLARARAAETGSTGTASAKPVTPKAKTADPTAAVLPSGDPAPSETYGFHLPVLRLVGERSDYRAGSPWRPSPRVPAVSVSRDASIR